MYDVVIIGAGPAGLFAAYELAGKKVLVIDIGKDIKKRKCPAQTTKCTKCTPCNVMCGLGGAGGLSDGKLNLRYDIGGNLADFVSKPQELVDHIDSIFLEHGVPDIVFNNKDKTEWLERKAASCGIRFLPIRQRHIGSDFLPAVVTSIREHLESKGVKFALETDVTEILAEKGSVKGVKVKRKSGSETIHAKNVIAAVGRSGSSWLGEQAEKLGVPMEFLHGDIGVRVEIPNVLMQEVTSINYDPKFHIRTKTYDDFVRTFCTNPRGFITQEDYGSFISVNGHALRAQKSNNTNFALLVSVSLTQPVEDTSKYLSSIAKLATTIGGGKPILQRLEDLRKGRRSTWKRIEHSYVTPTLKHVTPGDISMALPHRVVADILEALEALDCVIPGISSDSTLLYAPEVKLYNRKLKTKKTLETTIKGLYAVGDGAGIARGIIPSAATGVIAARDINSS